MTPVLRRLPRESSRTRAVAVLGINNDLVARAKPLRQMASQPSRAFHHPAALRELRRPAHQLPISVNEASMRTDATGVSVAGSCASSCADPLR